MKIRVLNENGYEEAIRGLAYSYKDRELDPDTWWEGQREKAIKRAEILCNRDGGHNKFLESIAVWIDIEAPRCWWSEMDTYRVGTTKQSESTMHTLSKRPPTITDFEEGTPQAVVDAFSYVWKEARGDINILKYALPEGFLQRRIVCTNYKVLRNIFQQRTGHRLKIWNQFIAEVRAQVAHPTLLLERE